MTDHPTSIDRPESQFSEPLAPIAPLQQQLDSLREQLTESQRLATIGTIAAVIAHEFNNILTPIVELCPVRPGERPGRISGHGTGQEGADAGVSRGLQGGKDLPVDARTDAGGIGFLPSQRAPRRTCFIGNGRTFHETFSRLIDLPAFWVVSTTGSCGGSAIETQGIRVQPATAAIDAMKKIPAREVCESAHELCPQSDPRVSA